MNKDKQIIMELTNFIKSMKYRGANGRTPRHYEAKLWLIQARKIHGKNMSIPKLSTKGKFSTQYLYRAQRDLKIDEIFEKFKLK